MCRVVDPTSFHFCREIFPDLIALVEINVWGWLTIPVKHFSEHFFHFHNLANLKVKHLFVIFPRGCSPITDNLQHAPFSWKFGCSMAFRPDSHIISSESKWGVQSPVTRIPWFSPIRWKKLWISSLKTLIILVIIAEFKLNLKKPLFNTVRYIKWLHRGFQSFFLLQMPTLQHRLHYLNNLLHRKVSYFIVNMP